MQTAYLDISNKGVLPTIYAKQGDVGRKFLAIITDNGTIVSGLQSPVFSVWYEGASGSGNYSAIDDRPAVVFDGKNAEVEMIAQMLVNAGNGQMTIVLNDALGKQIGLWNIEYCVEPVAGQGSEEATDYYTALSETATRAIAAAERAENAASGFYVDNTLTQEGAAAEAKATGEKIELLQEALDSKVGTEPTLVDSVEEITKSGYYKLGIDVDGLLGLYTFRAVADAENNRIYLYGNTSDGNLQRIKSGSVWGAWEWENPQMQSGTEYRTTERFEGKPVYAKVIYFGSLPANTSGHIAHGISGIDKIVSCTLSFFNNADTYSAPYFENGTVKVYAQANATYVTVGTTSDYSVYTGVVALKYTKK